MDDQVTPVIAQSSAARAFDDLRGEVSLLRRLLKVVRRNGAISRITAQPSKLGASNDELRGWAKTISGRGALQLTPQQIGEQIEAAASRFRRLDRQELVAEHARLAGAIDAVKGISREAHTHEEQVRWLKLSRFVLPGSSDPLYAHP